MQQSSCLKNLILLMALSSMSVTVMSALCGGCMENNVACINSTHFKPCVLNNPLDSILKCDEGKVCTEFGDHCQTNGDAVCKETDTDCRSCDSESKPMFVCSSRTTFQMCNTKETVECPTGTFCSYDSGKFCVKDCELVDEKYECNRPAPIPTN